MFTICIKDIKNVEKDIITLIKKNFPKIEYVREKNMAGRASRNTVIDFLKHIRYRTSLIIHIQDEEIKFQKEILYECLDTRIDTKKIGYL